MGPMGQIVLRGEGLGKVYRRGRDDVSALSDVSIEIKTGELVAIMGPSGCGKSTLLHLLCGIDTPSSGHVFVQDADLGSMDDDARAAVRRAHMGLLFQGHALLPGLTVAENAALPLALAGVDRHERAARAAILLDMVGLGDRGGDLPDDLSGGQRQRVALARALSNSPAIVMADEPTGSLDSATANSVLEAMVGLLRAQGAALVMVTHDPKAAARADRVILLRDGHIEDFKDNAWAVSQDNARSNRREARR